MTGTCFVFRSGMPIWRPWGLSVLKITQGFFYSLSAGRHSIERGVLSPVFILAGILSAFRLINSPLPPLIYHGRSFPAHNHLFEAFSFAIAASSSLLLLTLCSSQYAIPTPQLNPAKCATLSMVCHPFMIPNASSIATPDMKYLACRATNGRKINVSLVSGLK